MLLSSYVNQSYLVGRAVCFVYWFNLETLSFNKRVREIELLLYETEVKRVVTIDKRLSDQEKKCLLLASSGKNIQETAHILGVKFPTAREYRNSAIKKLKARNITAAVRFITSIWFILIHLPPKILGGTIRVYSYFISSLARWL